MEFIKGMDISMLWELEKSGAVYYRDGKAADLLEILKDNAVNLIRLRIWNAPCDEQGCTYGGGANDFESVKEMAKRIREQGMLFLLDFHYSDFWTDPKKQMKPKAWRKMHGAELGAAVYQYTIQVLRMLQEEELLPDLVQIGNELTNGFLWPDGKLAAYRYWEEEQEERDYGPVFSLLEQGIRAVREMDDKIEIVLHLDCGGDNRLYREWFDEAAKRGISYDMIGLSYYPYWHGSLQELEYNLQDISKRYDRPVLVVETSYGFTLQERQGCSLVFNEECARKAGYPPTPEGQASFLKDLSECIRRVEDDRGRGFVYWEPAWIPVDGSTWATEEGRAYMGDTAPGGNTWANQALFDYEGNILPGLKLLKEM